MPWISLIRLNQPIGFALVLLPCFWALALISLQRPLPFFSTIFCIIGGILARSAGCICNDLTDQKFDIHIERTKNRALANNSLSRCQAYVLLCFLCMGALWTLCQFNRLTIVLGCTAAVLSVLYPWMKRLTDWPQVVLGFTFNFGVFIGWTAIQESFNISIVLVYAAAVIWTLYYDTIYAHQDKCDDAQMGVRSTALRLGSSSKPFLIACMIGFVLLLGLAGLCFSLHACYYICLNVATCYMLWQIHILDLDDPQSCLKIFKNNIWIGLLILFGILSNHL